MEKLRAEVIELRGQRCQRCREDKPGLALHHVHYRTLGHETPEDVELLCADCHEIADAQRRKHNSQSERIKREARAQASASIAPDGEPANSPDRAGATH
jgi:hypothetical protein